MLLVNANRNSIPVCRLDIDYSIDDDRVLRNVIYKEINCIMREISGVAFYAAHVPIFSTVVYSAEYHNK